MENICVLFGGIEISLYICRGIKHLLTHQNGDRVTEQHYYG
jgi:hypothetical protein